MAYQSSCSNLNDKINNKIWNKIDDPNSMFFLHGEIITMSNVYQNSGV